MTGYKKIFLDTPVFIYLLEDHPVFGSKASSILDNSLRSGVELTTSVITWMEFCVKPYELNKTGVIGQFRELLNDLDIILPTLIPISPNRPRTYEAFTASNRWTLYR